MNNYLDADLDEVSKLTQSMGLADYLKTPALRKREGSKIGPNSLQKALVSLCKKEKMSL